MDYEPVRSGLAQAIPYNRQLRLELAEIAEGSGSVRLPDDDELKNHAGSQHAGGLFSAGDSASGAAFVGAFAERMRMSPLLAKSATIEYLKLALGAITATARLTDEKSLLLQRLDAEGRVEFPIEVELTDEQGTTVARMTVDWHVRRTS